MKYEDLVAKREGKEEKDRAKAEGKGTRGRKRKCAAPANAPADTEPKAKVARMSDRQVRGRGSGRDGGRGRRGTGRKGPSGVDKRKAGHKILLRLALAATCSVCRN